jgi:hypothetical protein
MNLDINEDYKMIYRGNNPTNYQSLTYAKPYSKKVKVISKRKVSGGHRYKMYDYEYDNYFFWDDRNQSNKVTFIED